MNAWNVVPLCSFYYHFSTVSSTASTQFTVLQICFFFLRVLNWELALWIHRLHHTVCVLCVYRGRVFSASLPLPAQSFIEFALSFVYLHSALIMLQLCSLSCTICMDACLSVCEWEYKDNDNLSWKQQPSLSTFLFFHYICHFRGHAFLYTCNLYCGQQCWQARYFWFYDRLRSREDWWKFEQSLQLALRLDFEHQACVRLLT